MRNSGGKLPVAEWWNMFKLRAGYGVTGEYREIRTSLLLAIFSESMKMVLECISIITGNGSRVCGCLQSEPGFEMGKTSGELNVGLDWEISTVVSILVLISI